MPELPEVEGLRGFLHERLVGAFVDRVELGSIAALKTYSPQPDALLGAEIDGVGRWGKFLGIAAQGTWLIFHLARAGWLRWYDEVPAKAIRPGKHPVALRLAVDSGAGFDLTEAGTQKRLAMYVVADPQAVPGIASLGPDPLADAFTREVFDAIVARAGKAQIKGVLREQSTIAGIGNAWSDEILHAARLSPFKPAANLTDAERALLYDTLRSTLAAAVDRCRGLPPSDLKDDKRAAMAVHGRTGEPCPVCGTTVAEVSFADSSLQYCPGCQTGGKPLADRRMSKLLK